MHLDYQRVIEWDMDDRFDLVHLRRHENYQPWLEETLKVTWNNVVNAKNLQKDNQSGSIMSFMSFSMAFIQEWLGSIMDIRSCRKTTFFHPLLDKSSRISSQLGQATRINHVDQRYYFLSPSHQVFMSWPPYPNHSLTTFLPL